MRVPPPRPTPRVAPRPSRSNAARARPERPTNAQHATQTRQAVHAMQTARGNVLVATFVILLGAFVFTSGAGSGNGFVGAIGLGIAISAVVYVVFTVAKQRMADMVAGTAHIVSATAPPGAATHGRCEMHLVVQAPRLPATAVSHRDPSVPVAKWPAPGGTLPVAVDPHNPRELRIRWDRVTPHPRAGTFTKTTQEKIIDAGRGQLADASILPESSGIPVPVSPAVGSQDPVLGSTEEAAPKPATAVETRSGPSETDDVVLSGIVVATTRTETGPAPTDELPDTDGQFLDLDFLDPPHIHSLAERDSVLLEYGSPIREVGVTLIVSNLEDSLAFYRDLLGFFEIERGPDMALLEARTGRLVLRQRPGSQAKPPRLMYLTLEVNDIDTAHRTLTKRGVDFLDEPRPVLRGEMLELWAASFHDPDGHGVALTSWLPREEDAESS